MGGRERVALGVRGRRLAAAARARAAARALGAPRAQRQARRALRRQDHARRQVSLLYPACGSKDRAPSVLPALRLVEAILF